MASDFVSQVIEGLPKEASVLEGYAGVAYRRKFFDLDEMINDCFLLGDACFADDVLIGGHLAKRYLAHCCCALMAGRNFLMYFLPKNAEE